MQGPINVKFAHSILLACSSMNYGRANVPQTVVISIQLTCDAEKNPVRNTPSLLERPPSTQAITKYNVT